MIGIYIRKVVPEKMPPNASLYNSRFKSIRRFNTCLIRIVRYFFVCFCVTRTFLSHHFEFLFAFVTLSIERFVHKGKIKQVERWVCRMRSERTE